MLLPRFMRGVECRSGMQWESGVCGSGLIFSDCIIYREISEGGLYDGIVTGLNASKEGDIYCCEYASKVCEFLHQSETKCRETRFKMNAHTT